MQLLGDYLQGVFNEEGLMTLQNRDGEEIKKVLLFHTDYWYPAIFDISGTSHSSSRVAFLSRACRNIFVMHSTLKNVFYGISEHSASGCLSWHQVRGDTRKRELLKNPTKIEEIQEKKFIDRNWTITTCLLRHSNPNYQCCMFCRMRLCRILQSMQHTHRVTQKNGNFWNA